MLSCSHRRSCTGSLTPQHLLCWDLAADLPSSSLLPHLLSPSPPHVSFLPSPQHLSFHLLRSPIPTSTGAIAGIVVGTTVFVILVTLAIVFVVFIWYYRTRPVSERGKGGCVNISFFSTCVDQEEEQWSNIYSMYLHTLLP